MNWEGACGRKGGRRNSEGWAGLCLRGRKDNRWVFDERGIWAFGVFGQLLGGWREESKVLSCEH